MLTGLAIALAVVLAFAVGFLTSDLFESRMMRELLPEARSFILAIELKHKVLLLESPAQESVGLLPANQRDQIWNPQLPHPTFRPSHQSPFQ